MAAFVAVFWLLLMVLASSATCDALDFGRFKLKLPSLQLNLMSNNEVCYGALGCFGLDGDFASRPLNVLPAGPTSINTKYYLYTRANATGRGYRIRTGDLGGLLESGFDPLKPSKLIIHGLLDHGRTPWINRLREALLLQGDYNVIQVDWGDGSHLPYTQATANTRVAGAEIARLLTFIKSNTDAQFEDFHLIGHSLGSHVAGYAGERLRNLGRITALDPAGPYFEGMPASVKVDDTDAKLVDVIHTDASNFMHTVIEDSGLGMEEGTGDLDFYPNNGREQPGCEPIRSISTTFMRTMFEDTVSALFGGGRTLLACSHLRALSLMIESLTSATCPFRAYPCTDHDTFLAGRCLECSEDTPCADLGIHTRLPSNRTSLGAHHHLYLQTGGESPLCRHHYGLSLQLGGSSGEHRGWLNVIYMGTNANVTERISASPGSGESLELAANETYTSLSVQTVDVGYIYEVQAWWKCDSPWWDLVTCWESSTVVSITRVDIFHGETQTRYQFIAENEMQLTPGQVINLRALSDTEASP